MARRSDHLRVAPVAALAGIVLCACGASRPAVLSAAAASQLHFDLARVESSVSSHDLPGATRALDGFAAEVARENAGGHLSRGLYTGLETAIGRTRARLGAEPSTAPAPASSSPTPASSAPAPVSSSPTPASSAPASVSTPLPAAPTVSTGPSSDQSGGIAGGKTKDHSNGNGNRDGKVKGHGGND